MAQQKGRNHMKSLAIIILATLLSGCVATTKLAVTHRPDARTCYEASHTWTVKR